MRQYASNGGGNVLRSLWTVVVAFAVVLFLFTQLAAGEEDVSDAALEKMKVKELKAFLAERGAECPECIEKSQLVSKAKSVKTLPKKQAAESTAKPAKKRKPSTGPASLTDSWRSIGEQVCTRDGASDCDKFGEIVAKVVGGYGGNFLSVIGKTENEVRDISLTEPFKSAGEGKIKKCLTQFKTNNGDEEATLTACRSDLSQWFLNTAIGKKESMFGGMDLDDLLRRAQASGKLKTDDASKPSPKSRGANRADDTDDVVEAMDDEL